MRFVIPLAAEDSLFSREDFGFPKPLIEVDGVPMIERVVSNIRRSDPEASFIFILRREDCSEFSLDSTLKILTEGACKTIILSKPTAGAACSALLASELICDDDEVIICNGDQLFEIDILIPLKSFRERNVDAGVITFPSVHPRWSYVRVDGGGLVIEAAEKRVISRQAIAGFYYFLRGRDFVQAAYASILNERHFNGNYYIAPTLNELLLKGLRVGAYDIAEHEYSSLYSPQRIKMYERLLQSRRILSVRDEVQMSLSPAELDLRVNIVIPMAGNGSRFARAGYQVPKPFIDVNGQSMIESVIENLSLPRARFILVAQAQHLEAYPHVASRLMNRRDVQFATIEGVTEGAACTVLRARKFLDPMSPLMIANCDQLVDFSCSDFVRNCFERNLDGAILTFEDRSRNPKWSFVRMGEDGLVKDVREKEPVSDLATVGVYLFKRASLFFDGAIDMISRNDRINNEFYVAPVYNYVLEADDKKIGAYTVPAEAMHGIGTPEDLLVYLQGSRK